MSYSESADYRGDTDYKGDAEDSDGAPDIDGAAPNIDYDTSSESSDSSDSNNSICKDIDDLIDSCHELNANVIIANNLLSSITDKINRIQSINFIYEGEKMDFYDLLELLHVNALNNIKEGKQNSFENELLKSINISLFV
jgi:hypothetical protein